MANIIDTIVPFSYIRDKKQNIYIVRVIDSNKQKIFAKLLYINDNGLYVKKKATKLEEYYKYHKWISHHEIDEVWSPLLIDEITSKKHFILKKLYQLSYDNDVDLFLIGSRLIGLDNSNSDWDFLVKCHNPMFFYKQILQYVPDIRKYNQNELFERAKRYSIPNSLYSLEVLFTLFKQTCTYTKYGNMDIGLFFIKSFQNQWIESTIFVDSIMHCSVITKLSDSYSMPRIIAVRTMNGCILNILYTDWLLYGLENYQNNKQIDFFNLWKVNDKLFVLDNEKGYVKF
ncbi:MAG: hypothetical protein LBE18_07355 [Planctomycetaceae bacterium]|jgi:hypothetical protein|nr:hypothetical protein [Planctomycetaceae bacterium]